MQKRHSTYEDSIMLKTLANIMPDEVKGPGSIAIERMTLGIAPRPE